MTSPVQLAEVAAMIGEPSRAVMLLSLADGRALPAGELAAAARVTPQTASDHLAKLLQAGLLSTVRQGRHRYYRLASERVGALLESIMIVTSEAPARHRSASRIDQSLRDARTCYNHLAGRLAVAIVNALVDGGHLRLGVDGGEITTSGILLFEDFGLNMAATRRKPWCKVCIDWSERCEHLGGYLGAALCTRFFDLDWIRRQNGTRAVDVTQAGRIGMQNAFDLTYIDKSIGYNTNRILAKRSSR